MPRILLNVVDLHAEIDNKVVLKGLNLKIHEGEIHTIMGPNGSGKSTLLMTLMGHPKYQITQGEIIFKGKSLGEMSVSDRAINGLFLSFQYPREISIQVGSYLRTIYNHYQQILDSKFEILSVFKFQKLLSEKISELKIDRKFIYRNLNEGFSGGEKKKMEILQMALLNPNLAMLDEIDSGLDVDALKVVSNGVNKIKDKKMGILLVTHYQRILKYIDTDFVHVMKDGKIVASGDKKFAKKLEKEGYEGIEILNS
ncbi:MAG: FeS assembly ATPase SufC, Fe-S cluster assembly ATP-binding protein [Candidatus Peregrinibacteria bacterium GW2011_GWF2_33_10]|nr:MAG: FeS assembly ATPase SufC, Fe-S cluster assembly ATP-binding protein [Candidatus Peregrinibacteria bacterium GW2011_GWF2_33_10]OGJ45778.1 MAG: Fe-S cluster assembly ATPase SufC [Candidatus Peregrinibacteria bacterium RIFOXYA2_FULL_33_21]OGJ46838.1 MAG: Fe-S cluster assembly ATPase SufC [Candidatus Peregrinibacteria bacterium RIFOXYA12_FULL_33_12]OGJ51308.1 MAG: Fe-S cluster assembly ATPase SufC [Candidatus Peregrinibacteria bacterium RIFOXYB2_FULL_33_20]